MKENSLKHLSKLGSLSLLPLGFFLLIYIGAGLWFNSQGHELAFYQFPAPSCALLGWGLALVLGYRHVGEHISVFIKGIGDDTVILMCLIFLLAGAFSALSQATGSVNATVNLGLYVLANRLLLPGIFLVACFISFSMGTSMGTISTLIPIAIGIAQSSGLSLPLVAATVIGGAMFGDNLSVISDTTIAATGTQACSMKEKMAVNLRVALPAALIVFIGLFFIGENHPPASQAPFSLVHLVPYALVLLLAIRGTNVILVLMVGILASIVLGLSLGSFHLFEIGKIIYTGFLGMADVFFVTFLIAGLAALAAREGGLDYLVNKISVWARGTKSAELVIASCVSLADICVANNTVAILLSGPVAKKIALHHKIAPARVASLLDVFSCVWQGLLPYGAQLLLAGGLCKLSGLAILPYSFYPFALGIIAIIDIIIGKKKYG